jgi:hypothetical protein
MFFLVRMFHVVKCKTNDRLISLGGKSFYERALWLIKITTMDGGINDSRFPCSPSLSKPRPVLCNVLVFVPKYCMVLWSVLFIRSANSFYLQFQFLLPPSLDLDLSLSSSLKKKKRAQSFRRLF